MKGAGRAAMAKAKTFSKSAKTSTGKGMSKKTLGGKHGSK